LAENLEGESVIGCFLSQKYGEERCFCDCLSSTTMRGKENKEQMIKPAKEQLLVHTAEKVNGVGSFYKAA
jgi:hypothetical protein